MFTPSILRTHSADNLVYLAQRDPQTLAFLMGAEAEHVVLRGSYFGPPEYFAELSQHNTGWEG